ncbi:hypothetical protein [Virgibacillus sp. MG-45]|uniref:hypothetical protein n=1 Tax=Virgibacillus sp. MG-45 TaxID=3102791 RepID=UPI002ED87EFB
MFSFRGDVHKLYRQLKQAPDQVSHHKLLEETKEIQQFYETLESKTLKRIYFRMVKENNGSGIIPILVSAIPWLFFLFSDKIQEMLFKNGNMLWIIFCSLYLILLTVSTFVHFREKAWAAFHIEIIQDILKERQDK